MTRRPSEIDLLPLTYADLDELKNYLDSMDVYGELFDIEEHNPELARAARNLAKFLDPYWTDD